MKFQSLASVLLHLHSCGRCPEDHLRRQHRRVVLQGCPSPIHNATYDSTFDMDYYSQQQMPWIYSLFKPFGMTGYTITTLGLDAPYSTLTLMYFPTAKQFEEALAAHGDEIFARVPLFSSEYPPHYVGQVHNIAVWLAKRT